MKKEFYIFMTQNIFLQPICRNSFINLEDMLENGTVINNMEIETPKDLKPHV